MTPRLIAFCSPAPGSGKSTAADHLVNSYGFERLSFATPLKKMADAFLFAMGMSNYEITQRLYGSRKEEVIPSLGVSARHVMRTIGDEWGRQCIKESVWVDVTIARAKEIMKHGRSVVIDDMRFPNEYGAVTLAHGDCFRVVRPGATVTSSHASEGQLDLVAMPEIWNQGSLADLYAAVDRALSIN